MGKTASAAPPSRCCSIRRTQELVKKGDVVGVKEALVRSAEKGMQSFDMALYQLYLDGKVTLEEAISNADSRTNLEAKINFG
jgi:twitching motility protein PilU